MVAALANDDAVNGRSFSLHDGFSSGENILATRENDR